MSKVNTCRLAISELRFEAVELLFVGDKCNADKRETIDALKDNTREAIDEIQLHTIGNMFKNWTDRVGYCMAKNCLRLLTGRIAFSNKKRNFLYFLTHFKNSLSLLFYCKVIIN